MAAAAGPAGGKADDVDEEPGDAEPPLARKLHAVDMSFLIPPPPPGEEPVITLDMEAEHGELLPDGRRFFKRIPKFDMNAEEALGLAGMSVGEIYDSISITGVRYDPCATQAFLHGAEGPVRSTDCEEELRLVAQPYNVQTGRYEDHAMHLVYEVEEGTGRQVRDDLRALQAACRVDTSEHPVGPHPCLQGLTDGDPLAQAYLEKQVIPFIERHMGVKQLKGVASMVTVQDDDDGTHIEWRWRIWIDLPAVGLALVPLLPKGTGATFAFRGDTGEFEPQPRTELETPSGVEIPATAMQLITPRGGMPEINGELEDALRVAYMAENPRLSALPHQIDCVSCHVQGPALTVVEDAGVIQQILDTDPEMAARLQEVSYRPLDDLTSTHLPEARALHRATNYDVINFGYLFTTPSVNRRVANEADDVVRYVEEVFQAADAEPAED